MNTKTYIDFLGAAGTVTGSTYLISNGDTKLLVDAGIFQGERSWRERNWEAPRFNPNEISAVLLTHAHIDHTGMLPRYVALGLKAPIFCSPATLELAKLLLLDSAKLQREEAAYREKHGRSRHHPPKPLYTEQDVEETIKLLRPVALNSPVEVCDGHAGVKKIVGTWSLMGHILGACSICLEIGGKRIVFSGDIGRYGEPLLVDPIGVKLGDLLLIESTYGDRLHARDLDPRDRLADVISRTQKRGGVVVIPSFAVGRTQTLLYYLRELKSARRIDSELPIIVDSPMAKDATSIYQRHTNEYDQVALALLKRGFQPFHPSKLYFIRERAESVRLNSIDKPMIIISASGMLSGGRVLHHLKHRISDPRNAVVFVGFQPPGSRGDWLKQGHASMTLLGEEVDVRAEVVEISGLSAHGDRDELLKWCRSCSGKPGRVAVVHGEPASARAFSVSLRDELGWSTVVPGYGDRLEV